MRASGLKYTPSDMNLEDMQERFKYDMARLKKKTEKVTGAGSDVLDYDLAELTVSEDEFNDEES